MGMGLVPVETDDEFLLQLEGRIRGYGKMVVSGIVEIGRELVSAKQRVGHGRYTAFVTERLSWSIQSAERFVHVHRLFQNQQVVDFDGLTIDATSLYRIAAPSTPAEVRDEVLAKAAEPGGISREEVDRIVLEAREAEQAVAIKTVADRVRELTGRFNSDIDSVKRDAIEQLGVLRGEIDKQRQTFDSELKKAKGPPPKPESHTGGAGADAAGQNKARQPYPRSPKLNAPDPSAQQGGAANVG
jgi:hypothetical protein